MKWIKKGGIFNPERHSPGMVSHAAIPFADFRSEDSIKIYFSSRNEKGQSLPYSLEVDRNNPSRVKNVDTRPILPLGPLGTFDDSGIMPSWVITHAGKKFMYYIAWNPQVTVSYRLSIGLAVSEDGGETFEKYALGPVCDRSVDEPYFNTAPCVLFDQGKWRMWYISCTGWRLINDYPEPFYHVKYAESTDGINWNKQGIVCIDYDQFTQAIGRPSVWVEHGRYKMIYSYRSAEGYRKDKNRSYRLGYAESADGITWVRMDDKVGIERSDAGWDSEMMEYCHVYRDHDAVYLFYNGNGFGKTGIGYAVLAQ